ncbi:aminoglycoside 3'-phosphotransferase [Sanguibacter massiliensis]|uniref:aminoglycoside 3'-phosphotransferase n=1 Tax=Sanguibacter massiliensis TaxID=1973217 RepID=UPI000C844956|nr:aminoglycoside 3'-phosphotransferase [Sanguibacter massiliensis]
MSWPLDTPVPTDPVPVPPQVARLARGAQADDVLGVWINGVGGTTFRLAGSSGVRFVKWQPGPPPAPAAPQPGGLIGPPGDGSLAEEARRLAWAREHGARVPEVLDVGADDDGAWLVTSGLPGRSAVVEPWLSQPVVAARALGAGLRALHDALPVADCPWTWGADVRLARARARASSSGVDAWSSDTLHPDHHGVARDELLARLEDVPPVDRLVVAHGDACAPNTLLADDGSYLATIDLDSLGVADRWADLAVAGWSTSWNYGRDLTAEVCAAYGVTPDEERLAYYRLLWNLA